MRQQKKTSVFYFSISLVLFLFQTSLSHSQTPRPNILVILVDDMKWNSISLLNQENFLQTPNIDRIGLEGASFNYYGTNSICLPGRTALLTGKYGHITGGLNNTVYPSDTLDLLPKILFNNGYYTALCGKWDVTYPHVKPYFNYWLCSSEISSYYNDTVQYFNSEIPVPYHMTDFLTDTAATLISRIDTPFFLLMSHNAAHWQFVPQPQYEGVFDLDVFPHPGNFQFYTNNYPSFIYSNTADIVSNHWAYEYYLRNYYEMFAGVEASTGRLLDSLESRGILDNTMVIFTSDNSNFFANHFLINKRRPYEEDMRLPLLIRYPPMFPASTQMNNNFALNIDLAETVLEAAGVTDTFNMQGFSLTSLINGTNSRDAFLYELTPNPVLNEPKIRTYRDTKFQYNRYYCNDTTEELFDMVLDPFQNINLVNDTAHFSVLHQYRIKLDSIRIAMFDTAVLTSCDCYLKDPLFTKDVLATIDTTVTGVFDLYPNPAENTLYLNSRIAEHATVTLYNVLGQKLNSTIVDFALSPNQKMNVDGLAAGVYYFNIQYTEGSATVKFLKY